MMRSIAMLSWYAMLVAPVAGCSSNCAFREHSDDPIPPPKRAVQACIAAFEATSPDKRTSDIRKVLYDGKPAYLVISPCCDRYDYLYDAQGLRMCAPWGGISGKGDRKCTGVLTFVEPAGAGKVTE